MDQLELADVYTGFSEHLLPFPALVVLILTVLPVAAFLGYHLGAREYHRREYHGVSTDMLPGATSLGAMLALLGLLLGFAFSGALGWREARQTALVEEAMAISTAFLTADLLQDPGRTNLQREILAYSHTRIPSRELVASREQLFAFIDRSMTAQARIWPTMLAAFDQDVSDPIRAAVAGRVTEMLDANTRRIAAGALQIPALVRMMITVVAIAAIFIVGNRSGLQGRRLTWRTFTFSTVLAIVILVILDLDRSLQGTIQTNFDTLRGTIFEMETALAARSQ